MNPEATQMVVTNLTVEFSSPYHLDPTYDLDSAPWRRVEKDLYLHSNQESAWLRVARVDVRKLASTDLVVKAIQVGNQPPGQDWESRPCGIWILRGPFGGDIRDIVTDVDLLFGEDAVEPRPHWSLIQEPLLLEPKSEAPLPKLTVRCGSPVSMRPGLKPGLAIPKNGRFKILQISDTHMSTGPGVCSDATDAHGRLLPRSEADPLTVDFIGGVLDTEEPDLVVFTGDQLNEDVHDSQTAIFKVVAPVIERGLPFAAVFGNHDDEGRWALSREKQMSILADLPHSLCQPGPGDVDGIGNFYIQLYEDKASNSPSATLYFLDSHGQIESDAKDPDYDYIKQTQIDWFKTTSQSQRKERTAHDEQHISLVFMHIPVPEYGNPDLVTVAGKRGEPTEGPSFNSHFYDALADEGVAALGCGHDHVNDFCGQRPHTGEGAAPWLCYAGGAGFGGYATYDGVRYHRRVRVWELDAGRGELRTWKRVEHADERVDELVLVRNGEVVAASKAMVELDGAQFVPEGGQASR